MQNRHLQQKIRNAAGSEKIENMTQQTSISANRFMDDTGAKITHRHKILAALRNMKEGTFEAIARYAQMRDSQVWKRISELERDGLIADSGKKARLSSGCMGIVWRFVEKEATEQKELF